jgi:GntR family transcriptional regulator
MEQTFVPRYHEIEQVLRSRIAELEPDAPLPSDAQLCEEFAVSRMTARNAVQRLVQDGLVYRLPGRGTYVAEHASQRHASALTSFADEMRRKGRSPSSRLLERVVRGATATEAARLRVAEADDVVVVRQVGLADAEPVALETAILRQEAIQAVLDANLQTESLHDALVSAGLQPISGRATLGAAPAGESEAALLAVAPGWPLLVERGTTFDQAGRPLELTETRYAGGRYAFDVELVPAEPGRRS